MKRKLLILIAASFTVIGAAYAHEGAKGIVKIRMDAMSEIGKSMKLISESLSGKTEFSRKLVAKEAGAISNHAKKFPAHFKEKTHSKITEASPKIWEDPEAFNRLSEDLANYANNLAQNAREKKDIDVLRANFKKVGSTCKDCHADFRVKKQ